MRNADYQVISKTYDENKDRHVIPKDPVIEGFGESRIRVLDLACGTGNYLKRQQEFYQGNNIEWYGLDVSPEMLAIARSKTSGTTFVQMSADGMEFEKGFFDYVVCNFAFHQFEHKHRVLDLLQGVLSPRGVFKYRNILPEMMQKWWVYTWCPETWCEDMHRFWEKDLLVYELGKRGLRTYVSVDYKEDYRSIDTILNDYERRDNSQLAIIDDRHYLAGLARLKQAKAQGSTEIRNIFALVEILGRCHERPVSADI